MSNLRILNAAEQVAKHLREGIRAGVWNDTMPGGSSLAKELGVGRMTVDAALKLLEDQGELIPQGDRQPRRISSKAGRNSSMKVAFLPYLIEDYRFDYILDLHRLLHEDGHTVVFPQTSVFQMKGNLSKIQKLVEKTQADAWVIVAGTHDLLQWFAKRRTPAFALFGRRRQVPLAAIGPDKIPALKELTKSFLDLGHERISMLTRPMRRLPVPGKFELVFLEELERAGMKTGDFNLPDWDGKTTSLGCVIDSLFQLTPPTAMIIDEPPLYLAVQQHLARRGILAPHSVSLACTDWDPYFVFQDPSVTHLRWDSRPWVRRIIQWVTNLSQGRVDLRQSLTKTHLVRGGSIGPVP